MMLDTAYTLLLLLSLSFMVSMTRLTPKKTEHILFGIFCGSLAMVAIQWHSTDSIGPYQYLVAIGTSATCNVLWLMAMALFRKNSDLLTQHYLFAAAISLLVVSGHSIDFFVAIDWFNQSSISWFKQSVGEITTLFSSTVLMLTLWETLRGFNGATKTEKAQKALFASGFFISVFNCTVVAKAFIPAPMQAQVFPWFVVTSALLILLCSYSVIIWRYKNATKASAVLPNVSDIQNTVENEVSGNEVSVSQVSGIFKRIEQLMWQDKLFLQPELKMLDIAQHLNVPEYIVSNAIRQHSGSANFNQFVNAFRVQHAKELLATPENQKSTILAISLEVGFASIAPFNRAFKALVGCTPNEFRKAQQPQGKALTALSPAASTP